jgi:hypothetical protein
VLLYAGTIVAALLVVAVTKGSFRRLAHIELRWLWLLLSALAIQILLGLVTFPEARIDDLGFGLLVVSYVMVLAFCVVNHRTSGFVVVTIGVALNALVIVLNHGMPARDFVEARHGRAVRVPVERTVKHRPEADDDLLPFLSDVIALPGGSDDRFSVGDVVIALGIIVVCFEASRRPRGDGVHPDDAETTHRLDQ